MKAVSLALTLVIALVICGSQQGSASQSGKVPYTQAQVVAGKAAFAAECASCHGAHLQGVSGPALTGSAFGASHLTVSALRNGMTTRMPLNAPGSLSPTTYAAIIAYLLASNCVKPSANTPFPTRDQPQFKSVLLVGQSCPVK